MAFRDGKMVRGKHKTLTDFSATIFDIVAKLQKVKSVQFGHIAPTKGATSNAQRVKIGKQSGCILLVVRSSGAVQELRVLCDDGQGVTLDIARALRDQGIQISFK